VNVFVRRFLADKFVIGKPKETWSVPDFAADFADFARFWDYSSPKNLESLSIFVSPDKLKTTAIGSSRCEVVRMVTLPALANFFMNLLASPQ